MRLTAFFKDRCGAALIEFAFVFPFIMLLLFGAIEMTRYVLITQKVERAGYVLGDIVTQYSKDELTLSTLDNVFQQYSNIMNPYGDVARQVVVLSSVKKSPGDKKIYIMWQHVGGGTLVNDKTVSSVSNRSVADIGPSVIGDEASFSGDVAGQLATMLDNENMVVAEAFYQYEPIFNRVMNAAASGHFALAPRTLVRRTYFHPRRGDLVDSPPTSSSSSGGCTPCYDIESEHWGDICGFYRKADCSTEVDMAPCDGATAARPPAGWVSCAASSGGGASPSGGCEEVPFGGHFRYRCM